MADFSVTDAALSGFRLAGRRPRLVAAWALGLLVFYVVYYGLLAAFIFPVFGQMVANPGAAEQLLRTATGGLVINLVSFPVSLAFTVVCMTTVYRAVLRPQDKAFAYIRLGGDEFRVLVVVIVLGFLLLAAFGALAAGVLAVGRQLGVGVAFLLSLVVGALFAWISIRMSLASVIAFAERRFAFFDSWGLTRGRFWRLFGTYCLACLMAIMAIVGVYVVLLIVTVGGIFAFAASFQRMADANNWALLLALAVPVLLLLIAAMVLLGALLTTVLIAPSAAIYRAIGAHPASAAETFT